MKGKGLKKRFLGTFLSCVLALSTMAFAPMTVRAEGTLADVDCSGAFRQNESDRIEVTDVEQTYVFTSTTNSDATERWNAPVFFVYSGDVDVFVGRSDLYGWAGASNTNTGLPAGYDYQRLNLPADDAAWASWLDANKAGADCKITMRKVGDYAIVALSDNGVTSIVTVPVSGTAQVALSGDLCRLTNITSSGDHIDLSAAIDAINGGGNTVPEGTFELVDNSTGFRQSESPRIEVTETEQTYVFTSTSNADATLNWHSPVFFVYSDNGSELFAGRSDVYGWVRDHDHNTNGSLPTGYNYQSSNVPADDAAWASWLDANKAGTECKVTMRQVGNYAIVAFSNNGVTTIATIPASSGAYVILTGENCILTNITSSESHIDLSAAIDQIPEDEPGTDDPGTDEPGTDQPGTDEPGTDTPGGVFLDCPGFWEAHTSGYEITEEAHTYKFHSQTYANAFNYWDSPLLVVFNSADGLVKAAGVEGYKEYGVIRSDNYAWDGAGPVLSASTVFPEGADADWDAFWTGWTAANRKGVDCTVTTQLYNGCALVAISNGGITTTYALRIDPAVESYLAFTGEHCTLSDLQTSDQHLDLSAAKARANDLINSNNNSNNNSSAPAAPAAPASEVRATAGGEILVGTAWWTGMAIGSNQPMSGDGTWTWVVQASALADGYGAFSVEIYDPATNGYITTGSDMNAWTAEGFDPANAVVLGVPAELASNLVEGHTYVVTVTRTGNTFMVQYVDYTEGTVICTLAVTPGELVSNDVVVHVMAQVGTYATAFCEGALADIPASKVKAAGGEVLTGTAWWTGMTTGSNKTMSGDGTWTWTVRASSLMDGYGAFSVEIYDPSTNGYITTGSDMNAWTAEGFDPAKAVISGVPAELASNLVEGHTYAVTVTRSGNTFTVCYTDHTTGKEICKLVITPGETVGKDVLIHVMAQVGTFSTSFNAGTLIASLGDSMPVALCVIAVIGLAAIVYGAKKRFAR